MDGLGGKEMSCHIPIARTSLYFCNPTDKAVLSMANCPMCLNVVSFTLRTLILQKQDKITPKWRPFDRPVKCTALLRGVQGAPQHILRGLFLKRLISFTCWHAHGSEKPPATVSHLVTQPGTRQGLNDILNRTNKFCSFPVLKFANTPPRRSVKVSWLKERKDNTRNMWRIS